MCCAVSLRRSLGPRWITTASTGSTESRRSMNVSASTDRLSAHCKSSIRMATAAWACCPPTTSSNRAPTANDEAAGPVPSAGSTGVQAFVAARSS
jgi:hypothetical protein